MVESVAQKVERLAAELEELEQRALRLRIERKVLAELIARSTGDADLMALDLERVGRELAEARGSTHA